MRLLLFSLALRLHMTVRDLLERLGPGELDDWIDVLRYLEASSESAAGGGGQADVEGKLRAMFGGPRNG